MMGFIRCFTHTWKYSYPRGKSAIQWTFLKALRFELNMWNYRFYRKAWIRYNVKKRM
jgi:hypothetical protein